MTSIENYQINMRRIDAIRFILPLILFIIVIFFGMWEHWSLCGKLELGLEFVAEVSFFGILGPIMVFVGLSYLKNLLIHQINVTHQLETLNTSLENNVLSRTTELEERYLELTRANQDLKKLDSLKSDFISLISHELNGPLTSINGGLEMVLLENEDFSSNSRHVLEIMARESQRLTEFVQTVLDISRLEAGKFELTPGLTAISPLLHHVVQLPLSGQKRKIIWDISENLPPAWVDEISIEKVICNLVSNAHKYSPLDQPIEIIARLINPDEIEIRIQDHGPGIPQNMQIEIFEKFQRLEQSDHLVSKGWGLGLYFAKILAESQNCKINVQSPLYDQAEMPGSAFILTIPVKSEGNEDGSYIDN